MIKLPKYLLLSLCLISHLNAAVDDFSVPLSTPEQIIALTDHADSLIGGVVSPLAGLPRLQETDLIAKGAQDLLLSRTYIPHYMPCSFHWNINHDEWRDRHLQI